MSIIQEKLREGSIIMMHLYNPDGSYTDFSGTGNDGNPQNDPVFNREGVQLNGVDQNVIVNDSPLLSFGDGSSDNPCTFIYCGFIPEESAEHYLIAKNPSSQTANAQEYALFLTSSGELTFRCYDASESAYIGQKTAALNLGFKRCFAATYSGGGADTDIAVFADGLDETSATDSSGSCAIR